MFSVGVVLFLLDRTDSAALAGATVAAVTLPSLITGSLLGAYMDLTGRRRTLMLLDGTLMIATVGAIAVLTGRAPDWVIPLCALAGGLTWPLSFGGFTSLIAIILPARLVPQANALEASSFNTALVLGPALAGGLSAAVDPLAPLLVQIGLTALALLLIARIPHLDHPRARDDRTLTGVALSGIRLLVRSPALRSVTAGGSLGLFGLGLLVVAFPFFASEELGEEKGTAGLLWAAFALGSMAGALLLVRVMSRWPPEQMVLVGLAAFGLLMLSWPVQTSLPAMLAVVALAGAADGPMLTATFATRQLHVPPDLQSQVFTTAVGFKVGSLALGAAIGGPLVDAAGPVAVLWLAAAMQFVGVAAGALLLSSRGR